MEVVIAPWDLGSDGKPDPVEWAESLIRNRGKSIHLYHFEKKYLRQTGRNLIIVKARQLGISWTTAIKALYLALHNEGVLILFISLTAPQSEELMRHLIQMYNSIPDIIKFKDPKTGKLAPFALEKPRVANRGGIPGKTEIEFTNGSRVVSLPNNPISVRGYRADYVFWDEAASFPHEADMHAALDPTTSRGGVITYISTHRGTQSQFYEMSVKAKEGLLENHDYMEIPWTEMQRPEYANDPEVRSYLKKIGEIQRQYGDKSFLFLEEYCCIASDESVAMFPHETLKAAIELWKKHECEYRAPTGKGAVYCGLDIARTKDSTVLIAFEDVGEYAQVIGIWEWVNRPFSEQEAELYSILARLKPTLIRSDNNSIGKDISERLAIRLGSVFEPVDFTNPMKTVLVQNSYVRMNDKTIAIPPDTISDNYAHQLYVQLHNLRRERSERSTSILYVQADPTMHDDFAWAFMLGASCLVSPLPHTVMLSLGQETKITGVINEGTHKIEVEQIERKPLDLGILTSKELADKLAEKDKQKANEFMRPRGPPPSHLDCEECVKAGRKDSKGNTPQMYFQGERSYTAEYVCETCWTTYVKVRK